MTVRSAWEGLLVELSKVNAPSMLLEDFNYFFNKAINQYINKRYNIYDVNQQTTDDLRVLKSTAILTPTKSTVYSNIASQVGLADLFSGVWEVNLPDDYYHLLNCICVYEVKNRYKCYDKGNNVQFAAKRLTADSWSTIVNDYYNRPLPQRPYYYIHNVNTNTTNPYNPITLESGTNVSNGKVTSGTDIQAKYGTTISSGKVTDSTSGKSNFPRVLKLDNLGTTADSVDKEAAVRYGNASPVRMEIRYGRDDSVFELKNVLVDYIKTPLYIRLTQEQVDLTLDTSQVLEFPDYVCQEIIKEMVMLVMENTADPRLLTLMTVTQSIANPSQQPAQ